MNAIIDGSGSNGHHAQDGTYSSNIQGEDASSAGNGLNGANMDITLSSIQYPTEPGHINISGTKTYSDGHVEHINKDYHLGKTGLIHFISKGGHGGNGGKGGNGKDGYKGSRGANATKLQDATDGSPGGNGGDGGRGSSGGDGGDGGYIKISVRECDAHLLMLIGTFTLTGGNGGEPGSHGKAGKGGKGGSGGSRWIGSLSPLYEESDQTTAPATFFHGTDEVMINEPVNSLEYYHTDRWGTESINSDTSTIYNDNRSSVIGETTEYVQRSITRSTSRRKSGGRRGPRGTNGSIPENKLYKGSNGSSGTYEYGVINNSGQWECRNEKFCILEIDHITCEAQNNSEIFEPGSSIKVGMEVLNRGCVTPKYTPIRIEIDDHNSLVKDGSFVNAPFNLLKNQSRYFENDQRMVIKINDPRIVNDGPPFSETVILNKFRATMTKIERPVPLSSHDSISFVIQQPININEVISFRSPGDLKYEVFWFVENISNIDFGRNSTCKRLVRTKLTRGESNGIEIDNQEIEYLESKNIYQVTSRLILERNNTGIQQFTVTLQIGSGFDQPNDLKSIQTRKFTIQPPLLTSSFTENDMPHLFLDVTKNECTNINGTDASFFKDNGSINLILSKPNHENYKIDGSIKFGDGTKIQLNHYFNFDKDAYIYITQKNSPNKCDVTLTTDDEESHLFALIANTFDDKSNMINWTFQNINRLNNELKKYSTPFKLRMQQLTCHVESGTKIFEPNCKSFIEKLMIFNEGEMPSPNNQNIAISLLPTNNIIPDDSSTSFNINKSILYNKNLKLEKITENENLKFSIKDNENGFKNQTPLNIKEHITFNINIKSINHNLQNFNNFPLQEIVIQYPIEMGEYLGYRIPSAVEEKFSLFWKIKNISNIEFGKSSEVKRHILTSLDDNHSNILYKNEVNSLARLSESLITTKVKINDKSSIKLFNFSLSLGSVNSPKNLLQIQSYPFHLPPLSCGTYNKFDLVFDLNDGRLILNDQKPNDYVKTGNFQLLISTPKTNKVNTGDIKIIGKLQYTNGWIIKIDDIFNLDLSGWIHLYTNGKDNVSTGSIDIKIAQQDTHLLYLIRESCLDKCNNQSYKVIDNSVHPVSTLKYKRIYQFTLISYDCIPEDGSGIYEPGARVVVRKIRIKNTGEMPTPTSYDVEISVKLFNPSEIYLLKDNKLILPKPIFNSDKIILNSIENEDEEEERLEFQINQRNKASYYKPLNIIGNVDLKAKMLGIEREITSFTLSKQLIIQYPIQICPNTEIGDFPYENTTRIFWRLNNVSQIDFGKNSDIKRVIKVRVNIEKMSPKDSLKFETQEGFAAHFEEEISLLEAKKSRDMHCELVRTLENQQTFIDAEVSITLYIGSIKSPNEKIVIEIRKKYIEVSPNYEKDEKSDFLLVTNSKTTKKDIILWSKICKEIGLSMSIWDIRRQGHLDLFESGLIKDFLGKSIIILNEKLDEINFGQTIDYIDPYQFYQAVNHNIKFFIIGMNVDDQKIKNLFIPNELTKSIPTQPYTKIKNYVENAKTYLIGSGKEKQEEFEKSKEFEKEHEEKLKNLKEKSKEPQEKLKEPKESEDKLKEPEEKLNEPKEKSKESEKEFEKKLKGLEEKSKDPEEKLKEPKEKSKEPEKKLKEPEEKLKESEEKLKDPEEKSKEFEKESKESEKLKELEEKSKDPEEKLKKLKDKSKEPEENLKVPKEKLKEPEEKLKEPEKSKEPQEKLKEPKESEEKLKEPGEKLKEPEEKPKEPEKKLKEFEEKSEEPEEKLKDPEEKPKEFEKDSGEKLKDFKEKSKESEKKLKELEEKSKESEEKNFNQDLLMKTLDLECIHTHLRSSGLMSCITSPDSYREKKLRKLSKSLQKIYPGHRRVILSIINGNKCRKNYDQIILCKITKRTKQYLTYNFIQLDYTNDIKIKETFKVGLLSCIPYSKRLEKLKQILPDSSQDLNQKILKGLVEADLAMELNGLCGINRNSKKTKLIISNILLTQLDFFKEFCEFVKIAVVPKENDGHTDWALCVFAKLKNLLHYSKDKPIFKNNNRIEDLKKIIYGEYIKVFQKYNDNNTDLLRYLKFKAKEIRKDWKEKLGSSYDKKEKLKLFRGYMMEILKVNNLKTDCELLNDDLDIILSEDDYKIIEQYHNNTFNKIEDKKKGHKEQIKSFKEQNTSNGIERSHEIEPSNGSTSRN